MIRTAFLALIAALTTMSAALAATGSITASPNPCTLTSSGTCTTTLSWTSSGAVSPSIYVRAGNGSLMPMASGASGEVEVPWITAYGDTFELHAGPLVTDALLASVVVNGVATSGSGTIGATPNPCVLSADGTCSTTLTWTSTGARYPSVYVRAGNGPLMAMAGGDNGSVSIPWITAYGNTFELHAGPLVTDAVLASVVVNAIAAAPGGTISATPNPCVLSASGTCTTTLSWTSSGAAYPSIYVRAGNGPLMLMAGGASGNVSIPWITAAGDTFELHAGPLATDAVLASLTVGGVKQWSVPQTAAVSIPTVKGVFDDGTGGVYVVGDPVTGGGAVVQHFSRTTGWGAPVTEMPGLKSVQAVALDQGFALFGRDDLSWQRLDYTAAGRQGVQAQFAVDYPNGSDQAPTEVKFTRAYGGAIVAASMVTHDNLYFVQTREFRGGSWSAIDEANDSSEFAHAGKSADLVRTREGDVATFGSWSFYWTLALRRSGETAFTTIARAGCPTMYCYAWLGAPQLQQNGVATAIYHYGGAYLSAQGNPYRWLAADANPATELEANSTATGLSLLSGDATRLVREDGASVVLMSGKTQLTIKESGQEAQWLGAPAQYARCSLIYCAAFSRPDGMHLATLQIDTAGAAKIYISDRLSAGLWSGTAIVDLAAVQARADVTGLSGLTSYLARPSGQIIVGMATTQGGYLPFVSLPVSQ